MDFEILDVDPLARQRLRDAREDTWPIGNVDLKPEQRAGVGVGRLEQVAPLGRGLADPAREVAGVALGERALELFDAAPVLTERCSQLLRVLP